MKQKPILTVTLNPAVDIAADVAKVEAGPKLRLDAPRIDPGGGGVNVARAIAILGGSVEAFVALAGGMGTQLAELMTAAGIRTLPFSAPGETRHSLSVTETTTGQQYRFVLPGSAWPDGLSDAAITAIAGAARPQALVVLSGSQPPGVPADFPARLAARLEPGAFLGIDTSGPALARLITQPRPGAIPDMLRLDQAEAEATAGHALTEARDSADFAAALVSRGVARIVMVARGADGSVLAGDGLRLHCRPPDVPVDSAVGAGDSLTGAFILEHARGGTLAEALRAGTAAAAATVMTAGTELCRREDYERLLPECVLLDC